MSPYFHYSRTACGIPRVKVLGTKQDWLTLQRKVHSLATEVFAQDISTEKSLSTYLSRAETVIAKIHSSRDPKFWENMFAISGCYSGHTDMVIGWITLLYRNGRGVLEGGRCSGDDYYNYESHISTVSWKCKDTSKEFELRTGLLYSVINDHGQGELDKKFPWFEPQFGHVVLDKNFKMTAEQFQEYIDTVLKGADKRLWQTFFELLKDDPVMMDKGPGELKQRLNIARRQMEVWKKNSKDLELAELDLENSDFGSLIYMHTEDGDKHVIEKFIDDLVDFLQTMKIRKVVMAQSGVCAGEIAEGRLLRALIGNEVLEELTASCYACEDEYSAMNVVCEVLTHPKCRIRTLNVTGPRLKTADMVLLGNALMNSTAPIEHIAVTSADVMELADAIYLFSTKKNLKTFSITYPFTSFYGENAMKEIEISKRIYYAIRDSRTLEEVKLGPFGDLVDNSYKKQPIDVSDLFEDIAANLKLNTNLKALTIEKWQYDELLTDLVSVPSLRKITFQECPDAISLDFLDVTKNLESFTGSFDFTAEMVARLSSCLSDPACKIRELKIMGSNFANEDEDKLLTTLTKSFINNKSLTSLKISSLKYDDADRSFLDNIVEAMKNGMPLQDLDVEYFSKNPEDLEKLLAGLTHCRTLRQFKSDLSVVSEAGFNAVLQIVQHNTSLESFEANYYGWDEGDHLTLTNEQQNTLLKAAKALPFVHKFGINGVYL